VKRNKGLVLALLEFAESVDGDQTEVVLDGFAQNEVAAHVRMCLSGDLIEGEVSRGGHGFVSSLTWAGHDLLEDLRFEQAVGPLYKSRRA
jgi:hypothetical protein